MEKNVEISILCELYGKLLTEKQFAFLDDYYNNDLSLSEIAENEDITRQAVRDIIQKSEKKLYEIEKNLGLMKKMQNQEKEIKAISKELADMQGKLQNKDLQKSLNNIRKRLDLLI